jgi:hypothetical protein
MFLFLEKLFAPGWPQQKSINSRSSDCSFCLCTGVASTMFPKPLAVRSALVLSDGWRLCLSYRASDTGLIKHPMHNKFYTVIQIDRYIEIDR